MRRLYCQLTCSQDQSLFLDPKDTAPLGDGRFMIIDIDYYVSLQFKQGLFGSCKDVSFPGNNEKVLNLLCGTTAEKCTPKKLLSYMGSTQNGFAPFNIFYPDKLIENLSWMNKTIFKCNQPFIDPQTNKTAKTCSCQDCAASCPVLPPPVPQPTPRKIMGLDVLSFSFVVTYIILLLIFFPISITCTTKKNNKGYALVPDNSQANLKYSGSSYPSVSSNLPELVDSPPGLCEGWGSKLESVLRHWFTKWGVWCSYHPYYVMGACFLVIAILACGPFRFTVTTDPMDLSTHPTPGGFKRLDKKWVPFGSIFHKDLLIQALELQNHITNMGVPFGDSNITLEDICFQPLAPQTKKCAIQSIFQYFQNSNATLNKYVTMMGHDCYKPHQADFNAYDYHTHLLFCARQVLVLPL
ncbi:NPC intracellular cholesterol transporter 1 [Desmophyllum pertusum]|uniref:NPC intracellular cholesterol transporter 1 n=1 Tax=Desmophyllum pertusum TaxID=174260 RepID=A0A9W9YXW9_9CNID|nr:NPC intracellular cholesterol transporter 1 [Desmophyllum pertusum]